MAYIDSGGLFDGDRFDLMSDEARLFWPHFWCASNTMGRIELNYRKIRSVAFSRWKNPPSEKQFLSCIAEYRQAFLLYVYTANGSLWGQWDTSEKYLPRHKLAADRRSPVPNINDFNRWKEEYASFKSNISNKFGKCLQIGEAVQQTLLEREREIGVVVDSVLGGERVRECEIAARSPESAPHESGSDQEPPSVRDYQQVLSTPSVAVIPLRATGPDVPLPEDVESRIRAIADTAPNPQDYESGVNAAMERVKSAVNPVAVLRSMETNIPLWFAAMEDGRARMKPLRFVIADEDYMRKPREPTKKPAQQSGGGAMDKAREIMRQQNEVRNGK